MEDRWLGWLPKLLKPILENRNNESCRVDNLNQCHKIHNKSLRKFGVSMNQFNGVRMLSFMQWQRFATEPKAFGCMTSNNTLWCLAIRLSQAPTRTPPNAKPVLGLWVAGCHQNCQPHTSWKASVWLLCDFLRRSKHCDKQLKKHSKTNLVGGFCVS